MTRTAWTASRTKDCRIKGFPQWRGCKYSYGWSMLMCGRSHQSMEIVLKLKISKLRGIKLATGLTCWSSHWESACPCGGHGPYPGNGKIPRASGQLSPWATSPCAQSGCSATREATVMRDPAPQERAAPFPQLDKACAQRQRASTGINQLIKTLHQPATPPPLLVCGCKCESVSSHMGI